MVKYKCTDCGQEYDGELDACPKCGCPTEYQTVQVESTSPEEVSIQDNVHKKKGSNKKKTILIILPVIIIAGIVAAVMIYRHQHSYEYKMDRLEKVADEFKATLGPRSKILTERIDSVAQKVFYTIEKDPEFDIDKDVMVHDYETGETKSVLPASHKIEDYEFSLIGVKAAKMIEDRLFLIISSGSMGIEGIIGVFYVNIRDNSLHYVESCNDAEFEGFNSLHIKKMYRLGMQDEWTAKFETIYYSLSTLLSDEAYATNRWEQKRKEERLAEEWRKREEEKRLAEERRRQGVERILKFDYTLKRPGFEDHAGTLQGTDWNFVYTKTILIPKGKIWQLKSISYSGYSESNPPRFYYCRNVNGAFDVGRKELETGQILDSWGYTFWIMFDKKGIDSGHRTAEIVFMEKEY